MSSIKLNGMKLKQIATKSQTAEAAVLMFALRQRFRPNSYLTRTKMELQAQTQNVDDTDLMQFWKDLQAEDVGHLVYGRNGRPDRFRWHCNFKIAAQAAIEGTDIVADRVPDSAVKADLEEAKAEASKPLEVPAVPQSVVLSLKDKLEQRRQTTPVERRQRRTKAVAHDVKREAKPKHRGRRPSMVEFSLTKSEAHLLGKLLGKLKK